MKIYDIGYTSNGLCKMTTSHGWLMGWFMVYGIRFTHIVAARHHRIRNNISCIQPKSGECNGDWHVVVVVAAVVVVVCFSIMIFNYYYCYYYLLLLWLDLTNKTLDMG